ncbi:o-succinylbenzoate synthase [Paracrocinitomix mangrovi]|uniref:o-succinylbenzoate synthase n=1 Tax=Paracrocinitomix mangrovi TaxID=2862509 RepID=UPI001C8D7A87|nr:o-succinylbenzoate synthase [Paracrocinitomix mangrovi]UKN02053.1 o-succinylbenzoate synthase [Paracrocinitomix mangrovi]
MLKANSNKITLQFNQPAGTSRGVLKSKNSWIIEVWNEENPAIKGIGEASIIENLSPEWDNIQYERKLNDFLNSIHDRISLDLKKYPSIEFGIEAALLDLENGGKQIYFDTPFTQGREGISINGLIWMGEKEFMLQQIKQKMADGFRCLKLKIGAINFEDELALLKYIRSHFGPQDLELRVDANGAFSVDNAMEKLEQLSAFHLHSIEQPIQPKQWIDLEQLCKNTPIPIALDEELIGISDYGIREQLLDAAKPQYIILKPSLVGGFTSSDNWIELAEKRNIGWWITSALESNVGLNAIAQYASTKNNPMPQGLGTGLLFANNTPSTLVIKHDMLYHL